MSMSFVPDMGLDGDMAGYYALLTDITDLNEAREQLAQSQKLEAMGQLTGGVAHDFNNVLMAVLANLEMLEEDLGEGTEQVDMARAAKRAVRRGAEVTNQLLAFARKQTLAPTAIDLHELSLSLGTLLTPSMGETVDLSTRISEPLSPAFADRGLLQNALLNLAVNARDAMPDGGTLLIELGDVTLDATRLTDSDVAAPGDFVMIAVSDSGTGIEAHLLERIFDPFFTTKGMAKNSGLGMSMVQGFVQQSEGHLEIESEVGVGTTVRLFLPQAGTGTGAAAEAVSHQQAVPTGNETVLLVEDDVAVRETLASSLKRMGYTVVVVEDGPAALAVLAKQPVDAVVTDQIMPKGMTGTEMARQARKIRPDLDFVVITGYADALNSAAAGLKGNDQLLSKPFTTGTLAQALRNVLD
jgi:CheY-like chemotaxis protein